MSKSVNKFVKYSRVFWLVVIIAMLVYLIATHLRGFGYTIIVMIGFGAMIMVHELGHFIMAKLGDIHVEAFSIGMPPYLLGIKRTDQGLRVRILPGFLPVEQDSGDDGSILKFTIGHKSEQGETEYRVGMIPFGGFVKMLGQEDTKKVETNDNPRSYANKSVGIRMRVIVAGVLMNALSAIIIFIGIYMHGINLQPPVVGAVIQGSPAEKTGIHPGDEIIGIDGKSYCLDYADIVTAGPLSPKGESVQLKIMRDGNEIDFNVVAEKIPIIKMNLRMFGFLPARSLMIGQVNDEEALFKTTGLKIGDVVTQVNSEPVAGSWEIADKISKVFKPQVELLLERDNGGDQQMVSSMFDTTMEFDIGDSNSESSLGHIYSILPRIKVKSVADSAYEKSFLKRLSTLFHRQDEITEEQKIATGDVIVAVGDISNPTYKELRDITIEYADKELDLKVIRKDSDNIARQIDCKTYPRATKSGRVVMGIAVEYDADHAVVAKTINADGVEKLDIPRGAVITAVDGGTVDSFYDIIEIIRKNEFCGQRISMDYRIDADVAGGVSVNPAKWTQSITVRSALKGYLPLEEMHRFYQASGPVEAVKMGFVKAGRFFGQAVVTLKRLLSRSVGPDNMMGPVGILSYSYYLVSKKPLIDYLNLIGMLSMFIAVFNSLPILPFDGGHAVFLAIEKFRGKPVDERVRAAFIYVGIVLVLVLVFYVTYHDIIRSFRFFSG